MVEVISAYQASDSTLFASEWDALMHDAKIALAKRFDKEEQQNLILNYREEIYTALKPLVEHEEQQSKN